MDMSFVKVNMKNVPNNILINLKKSPLFVLRKVENEGILINIITNKLIHLNETGVLIWQLLDSFHVDELKIIILKTTNQKKKIIIKDIDNLLNDLWKMGALVQGSLSTTYNESDDFLDNFILSLRKRHKIFSAVCELTNKCNFKCKHCYIPSINLTNKYELDTKGWIKIIDDLYKTGVFFLLFTGGEPFLRPDFKDIYMHAKNKGFHITLYTNCYYLPDPIIPFLVRYPPAMIAITLYGASNNIYQKFTSVTGAWDRVSNNIKFLKSLGLNLKLRTQINKIISHELAAMRKFANENGIPFNYRTTIVPPVEGKINFWHDISLPTEKIVHLENIDYTKRNQRTKLDPQLTKRLETSPYKDIIWHCGGGVTSCLITPQGLMAPCVQLRSPFQDLKKVSVSVAWRRIFNEIKSKIKKSNISVQAKKCVKCDKISQCDICPAWVLRIEEKQVKEYVSFICELAEKRSKIFKTLGLNKIIGRKNETIKKTYLKV